MTTLKLKEPMESILGQQLEVIADEILTEAQMEKMEEADAIKEIETPSDKNILTQKEQIYETRLMLVKFSLYISKHKGKRFWEALRDWNMETYPDEKVILIANRKYEDTWMDIEETFNRHR